LFGGRWDAAEGKMINVTIFRDKTGMINGFEVNGHAGYAPAGSDIVCAAASATAYTAAGALEELAGAAGCHTEKSGLFTLRLLDGLSPKQRQTAAIILETAAIGFKQIENSYGKYLSVTEKEV
jgi:uncharacterized protein YsxB (DUF464 family)